MKKIIKTIEENIIFAFTKSKDLIIFPILGGIIFFITQITKPSFSISWFTNIDVWLSSFLISLFSFMIFDCMLARNEFFKKHKYALLSISFVISTILGESFKYHISDNLKWLNWLIATVMFIIGFIFVTIFTSIAFVDGYYREMKKIKFQEEKYFQTIQNMGKVDKIELIKKCNEAIALDDFTFALIRQMKTKQSIQEIINDLNKIKN